MNEARKGRNFLKLIIMDSINKVELQGRIGSLRVNAANGSVVANISLATDLLFKGRESEGRVETTWHNVVAWQDKGMSDLQKLQKGMLIHVTGRIRTNKYVSKDGEERSIYEIYCDSLNIIRHPSPADRTEAMPSVPMC